MASAQCEGCGKMVVLRKGACVLCGLQIVDKPREPSSSTGWGSRDGTRRKKKPSTGRMDITGGTFGLGGFVRAVDDVLTVATDHGTYTFERDEVLSVISSTSTEDKFGCLGFVVFAVILGTILGLLLNVLGIVIALVLSYFGSKYTTSSYQAEIKLPLDKVAIINCSKREAAVLTAITVPSTQ